MVLSKSQIIISEEKITRYLLVHKDRNDKSEFLAALGFEIENWQDLALKIVEIATTQPATLQQSTSFGDLYVIQGSIKKMKIVTVWMLQHASNQFRFVTLYPSR